MIKNKRMIPRLLMVLFLLTMSGCGGAGHQPVIKKAPEISQVRSICELATLECQYHNLAKSTKSPGKGILHVGEKSRQFWIDYQGTVTVSFNAEKIKMNQNGANIEITLPEPELECAIIPDSWNEDSYVTNSDHKWIQKNPITAADQTKAVQSAQKTMEEQVRNNSSLIQTAELQAQELIRNYINQIGKITGTEYHVTFKTEGTESVSSSSGRN